MDKPEHERAEKTERYDLKLKEILHKSAQVFAEKGFHNASVRDISRETGISLAGLYYYFQTKEELLYLILEDTFDSVLRNLEDSLSQYSGPERIRFFVENHLKFFVDNLAQMKLASHESESLQGHYWSEIQKKKRAYFNRLVEILRRSASEGGGVARVDPKLAALALFGMVNWIYTWYDIRKSRSIDEVAIAMSEIFLYGYLGRQ